MREKCDVIKERENENENENERNERRSWKQ